LRRGWGEWGGASYTDLMAITDAAEARPDIDETKVAAMGGSYGGYMANWIAGHTDRFRCIVTHASLWALDQFQGTTDYPAFWVREFGVQSERPERYEQWSPHHFLDNITTPMLVIHGDKDYRVPVGEGLRLWWDLKRRNVESSYLYFPDEGHWVLKPGNARVWYDTVWAWLAMHVHGEKWQQPELL
jgi:dipeptidyl aminopeptidase/acylaminoacyl peptidase